MHDDNEKNELTQIIIVSKTGNLIDKSICSFHHLLILLSHSQVG